MAPFMKKGVPAAPPPPKPKLSIRTAFEDRVPPLMKARSIENGPPGRLANGVVSKVTSKTRSARAAADPISRKQSSKNPEIQTRGGFMAIDSEGKLGDRSTGTDTGQELHTLKGHSAQVTSVAFAPDGTRLASASFDQTLKLWQIATGQERPGWPVKIVGTPTNDPMHPFAARDAAQRPGLLLPGGLVYMAFGSHCGYGSYVGWVAGINTLSRRITMWSDESAPSSQGAGIWQGGGGLVSDGPGRIFLTTGNGVTAPDGAGSTPPL